MLLSFVKMLPRGFLVIHVCNILLTLETLYKSLSYYRTNPEHNGNVVVSVSHERRRRYSKFKYWNTFWIFWQAQRSWVFWQRCPVSICCNYNVKGEVHPKANLGMFNAVSQTIYIFLKIIWASGSKLSKELIYCY